MSLPRAATSDELILYRKEGYSSVVNLAFLASNPVFKARINQSFLTSDQVIEITYDTVTLGAYADIIIGMSVWIGTSEGANDLGITRVRKASTATKIFIGECSEISFSDNLYITVVDDFDIWQRHIRVLGETNYEIDWEETYIDQNHVFKPIVIMGSDVVKELIDGVCFVERDASLSYVVGGGVTITGYSWACAGASSIDDPTTSNPTFHFDTAGTYLFSCTVTASNGKTKTSYRKFYIWDEENPPTSEFTIGSLNWSLSSGGCDVEITMSGQYDISDVHDRSKVVLFIKEQYGTKLVGEDYVANEISVGYLEGSENILIEGWISKESIRPDIENGTVTFTLSCAQYWLSKITGFTFGLLNIDTTPTNLVEVNDLTIPKALYLFFSNYTTTFDCMDVFILEDSRLSAGITLPRSSFWDQMNSMIQENIIGHLCVDVYGRLFAELDINILSDEEKDALPVVMTIQQQDRIEGSANITRDLPNSKVSTVFLSGVNVVSAAADPGTFWSLAPGHSPAHLGKDINESNYLVLSQSHINAIAGRMLASGNNEFPSIDFNMASYIRLIGICPNQIVIVSISASESPRNIGFSGKAIPKQMSVTWDENKDITVAISIEALTYTGISVDGDIPGVDLPIEPPVDDGDGGIWDPPIDWYPPPLPTTEINGVYIFFANDGIWYSEDFAEIEPAWLSKNNGGPTPTDIRFFEIDKLAGKVYVGTRNGGLWWGLVGDAFLYNFVDDDWAIGEFGEPVDQYVEHIFGDLGVNQFVADDIAVVIGWARLGEHHSYMYNGSNAGLTQKMVLPSSNTQAQGSANWGTSMSFDGTLWLATHGAYLNRQYWARYSAALTSVIAYNLFGSPATEPLDVGWYHCRAGISGRVYAKYKYTSQPNHLFISPDNLETQEGTIDSTTFVPLEGVTVSCSPSGQFLMAMGTRGETGDEAYAAYLKRSNDFGTTWGYVENLDPEVIDVTAICSVDDSRWIVAGVQPGAGQEPRIYYTEDFGDTWIEKSGNIATYVNIPGSTSARKIIVI